MSLDLIKAALLGVSEKVHHYHAPDNAKPPYIVWMEDGANDFEADSIHAERAYTGTVDLYTKTDRDPLADAIPLALNSIPCAWTLNSVQYEEDTKIIHYEWIFEV